MFIKKFFEGRLKRLNFFAAMLTVSLFFVITTSLIGVISGSTIIGTILLFVLYFFHISITTRRLHDIGWSGYLSLIFLLPALGQVWGLNLLVINLVLFLVLIFIKGDQIENKYGGIDAEKDIFKMIFPR